MPFYPNTAFASVQGGPLAPAIRGTVFFQDVPNGTMIYADISGLPEYQPAMGTRPQVGPHGFHIHTMGNCTVGDPANPFQSSGEHWNPTGQPHGNHAGDFPVLFSNHGRAWMVFFTDKFSVDQVIGKSIIIHQSPDDYRTQPAGDSGKRLACGVIQPYGSQFYGTQYYGTQNVGSYY